MVDNLIRLYENSETEFSTNGIGVLSDATKCEVSEEINGVYELEMQYPITGKYYKNITNKRIITAKPNPSANFQPFRIYYISKPFNGIVTVKAEHISYDMAGFPVMPFTAKTPQGVCKYLKTNSTLVPFGTGGNNFTFKIDGVTGDNTFELEAPANMRSLIGGDSNSLISTYGGELEFDVYSVTLHESRGTFRGVTISYGKNLTDLTYEESSENEYTAVYPFWYSEDFGLIELPEKIIRLSESKKNYERIYTLDLSNDWENNYEWNDEYPSTDELRTATNNYIKENGLASPTESISVSFQSLSKCKEYDTLQSLETVLLGDWVYVKYPDLNVSVYQECCKTVFDAITGTYVSIDLGNPTSTLSNTISNISGSIIKSVPKKKTIAYEVKKATDLITGARGGYVVINKNKQTGKPYEILIMDKPNVSDAVKIWRWNNEGLGFSSTGYNGTYSTAITSDGLIVADFIRSGSLVVGGALNPSGCIEVEDSSGNVLIRMDKTGIDMVSKCHGNFQGKVTAEYIIANSNYYISDEKFQKNLKMVNLLLNTNGTMSLNIGKLDSTYNPGTSMNYVEFMDGTYGRKQLFHTDEIECAGHLHPTKDGESYLGDLQHRWSSVYAKNTSISTSDERLKHNIEPLDYRYENLFFDLQPVSYMFNDGDRKHIGITAQQLKNIMDTYNITAEELGAYCVDVITDEDGNKTELYGVRYEEFIMLNTHMLQKAYDLILQQQRQINELKTIIENKE